MIFSQFDLAYVEHVETDSDDYKNLEISSADLVDYGYGDYEYSDYLSRREEVMGMQPHSS